MTPVNKYLWENCCFGTSSAHACGSTCDPSNARVSSGLDLDVGAGFANGLMVPRITHPQTQGEQNFQGRLGSIALPLSRLQL